MNRETRIGIVIPAFNSGDYVIEAAESAKLALGGLQNIVIIDDGSVEKASIRALNTLRQDGFSVHQQPNQGVSVARNTGISMLTTKYVLLLDSDDLVAEIAPTLAADCLDSEPEATIVAGSMVQFRDNGYQSRVLHLEDAHRDAMWNRTRIPITSAFRIKDWHDTDGFPPGIKFGEDWVFWMRLLKLNPNIVIRDEVFFYNRLHPDSATARGNDPRETVKALNLVLAENPDLVEKNIDEFIEDFSKLRTTMAAYRYAYRVPDRFKQLVKKIFRRDGAHERR